MVRPIVVPALAFTVLLAGCLAAAPGADPVELAGGTGPEGGAEGGTATFAQEGRTGSLACAWVPFVTGTCHAIESWPKGYFGVDGPAAARVVATLTWEARTPLTEELGAGVFRLKESCNASECGDDDLELVDYAWGPSPLEVRADDVDGRFAVFAWHGVYQEPVPVYVRPVDQPFHLEGEAVLLAGAP